MRDTVCSWLTLVRGGLLLALPLGLGAHVAPGATVSAAVVLGLLLALGLGLLLLGALDVVERHLLREVDVAVGADAERLGGHAGVRQRVLVGHLQRQTAAVAVCLKV